ncbi:chaperone protein ClpD, chloroplastic isoform X2 [Lycium ferocissimum]|uniref:chaperone protein ClpD, chloroplastic isoform X2 n=1 Tax=Lycium ferocissimum TaxID=112874 RepID=UPI0028153F48|nr:chaperone protein ClpD, chloroplastic isoform X2 [Lycium ferocissimum]
MELSCSSPLSVNFNPQLRRYVSVYPQRKQTVFSIFPYCPSSTTTTTCSTSSSTSSLFGISLSHKPHNSITRKNKRSLYIISGVFERFTERSIKAVMFSQKEAKALGKDMVYTQHLLLGLIAEDRSPGGFLGSKISIEKAREVVKSIWNDDVNESENNIVKLGSNESVTSATDVAFSSSTKRVFEAAVEYSRTMGYNFIAPEHIAIGLFTVDDGSAGRVLKRLGVNINRLAAEAVSRLQGELAKDGREPISFKRSREKSFPGKITIDRSAEKTKEKNALEQFCVDLTARASEGLIDPVIGRETEVQRIIEILCRRTKNNPILLGEAGVGKTAIAEGLAINIAEGNIPAFLMKKRVMSLDVGLLISGAKERGELEARVTTLIKEVKKSGHVILFIDEVHTLVGAGTVGRGNKGSGLDMANLLKPPLGRGELQSIASTTMDEFRLHIEKDKAFARRFQPVLINEPNQADAVQILLGLREKYESHHKCRYSLEAINAAVQLSARYIPDRYLPDKAIDLMDEAGSKSRMQAHKRRKEQQISVLSQPPSDYWQEIRAVQAMHEVILASKLTENDDASRLNDGRELDLQPASSSTSDEDEPPVVGPEEIAAVASLWTGIPLKQLTVDERMLLVGLDEQLKKRVVGQDEAVTSICRAVKRSRTGLKDPDRPISAMLFCGPTGVGKSELAKALAASYFGSESAMLRLDMSEYMERHTVSKLIGSPPGYVGYGEGGTLTEAIRKKPFTVVLLDEIEKAHPDIFNILLQLFEDGHLTDSQGRRVSFKNALIVMTSNVGSTAIVKGRQNTIGFLLADDESAASYAGMKAIVIEELKTYFRPELLNRIDEVVVFRPLEKTQMLEILNLMLAEVRARLVSFGISLEVSEDVMELICQQGFDRNYGARPLRRAVTQMVEDLLSESLLSGDFMPGDVAMIHLDESGNPVVINQSSQTIHLSDTNGNPAVTDR